MNLVHRSYQPELLDADDIPAQDIRLNLRELNTINSRLGGHRATLLGFRQLLGKRKSITICEIGCGGGDNLLAIYNWCLKNGVDVSLVGIDLNPDCIAMAAETLRAAPVTLITSDYRLTDPGPFSPDIIFSSLFCHHFRDQDLEQMLTWMNRNAGTGFFINDLHRHFLAYYSIKIITALFSNSYLVKNDAPLSVRRGFIRSEWNNLMNASGLTAYDLSWKWAFRWLLICPKQNYDDER